MITPSDTPRCDAEEASWSMEYDRSREAGWPSVGFVVSADFARTLEREVNRLKKELEEAQNEVTLWKDAISHIGD